MIGSPVWFWPERDQSRYATRDHERAFAAFIVWPHDAEQVTLAGFDHAGNAFKVSHVAKWDGGGERPDGDCWQWPVED